MMREFKSLRLIQTHPFVKRYITITAVIFTILTALLFLPWQQTVKGVGRVIAFSPVERDYNIVAPISGFLQEVYVKDNQKVKKGDKLFKIVNLDKNLSKRFGVKKRALEREIENLNKKIKNSQEEKKNIKAVYEKQIKQLGLEYQNIKNTLQALLTKKRALEEKVKIEKINYLRQKSLFLDGIVSKRDFERAKQNYFLVLAKADAVKSEIKSKKNEAKGVLLERKRVQKLLQSQLLKIQNSILDFQNAIKRLKRSLEDLNHQISAYKARVVYAKKDGEVVRVFEGGKERYVGVGEKVLLFAPAVLRYAIRLKVREFNMPLIHKGYEARVMFYGWPSIYISGWPKISYGTYGAEVYSVDGIKYEDDFYYALLVPKGEWPDKKLLRIGTEATVWVRLSYVPIWYEIWRILLGQPPKLPRSVKDEI